MVDDKKRKEEIINALKKDPKATAKILKHIFLDISGMMEMTSSFRVKKGKEKLFEHIVANIDCNVMCVRSEDRFSLIAPTGTICECFRFDKEGNRIETPANKMLDTYQLLQEVVDDNETIFIQYTLFEKEHKNNPPKSDIGSVIITQRSITYIHDPNPYI